MTSTAPVGRGTTVALGAGWGIVVWLVMFRGVLPRVGAQDLAHAFTIPRAITEHVVFGVRAALGIGCHRQRS